MDNLINKQFRIYDQVVYKADFKPVSTATMQVFHIINVIVISGFLYGCTTGSTIITGTKRSIINASEVRIYLDLPSEYESIGIIEVSSEVGFSRQAAQDKAMDALKLRAAKIGANGVLLTNTRLQSYPYPNFKMLRIQV